MEHAGRSGEFTSRRPALDPNRLEHRLEAAGWTRAESTVLALAVYATLASPVRKGDADWIASASARVGDPDLLLDMAGVVFAFNTVNRVADARRVRLEYHFLRELSPVRGWVERRFVTLTGLAYDLSYSHKTRHDPEELLDRLRALFQGFGAPGPPGIFEGLRPVPHVLEGIFEMIDVNSRDLGVPLDLWKQAVAIATASHAMSASSLRPTVARWLGQDSLSGLERLHVPAAIRGCNGDSSRVTACHQYAWRVTNAAYTITDEEIAGLHALGLSDAEVLDLTLGSALFSALAIIEPLVAAVAPMSISAEERLTGTNA